MSKRPKLFLNKHEAELVEPCGYEIIIVEPVEDDGGMKNPSEVIEFTNESKLEDLPNKPVFLHCTIRDTDGSFGKTQLFECEDDMEEWILKTAKGGNGRKIMIHAIWFANIKWVRAEGLKIVDPELEIAKPKYYDR